jgi:peptidoglycan-N-acetylglucosamine deacetylase
MTALSLTFDDGPHEYWTRCVLSALRQCRASATFFMLGERVRAAPEVARAVREAGSDVQLHGHRHVRHSELDEAQIEQDTRAAFEAFELIGVRPTYWRTPWGIRTPDTERVAERHGLTLVDWTIDTHDWRGDSVDAMLARARAHLPEGGVVLMHDGLGPGSQRLGAQNTVELLAPLIAAARAAGIRVGGLPSSRDPASGPGDPGATSDVAASVAAALLARPISEPASATPSA